MILALTGGTGFVGRRLIDRALAAGHQVRALTRRAQPPREGVAWIEGALDTPPALAALVSGADAAIHVAGVVNAPDREGFAAGNIAGTQAMAAAAFVAGVPRFVHVSSLAAREPALSTYGWSKAGAEEAVIASGLDWTIVRPPAVYGPGDTEMLDVFRLAQRGLAVIPSRGTMSAIHVDDLADALLALATVPPARALYEVEGSDGPMTQAAFARAIGTAVGRRVRVIAAPRALLSLAARGDRMVRGAGAKLTPDRVAYLTHDDWSADTARRVPDAVWRPRIAVAQGLADTAAWYRAHGLL